MSAWTHPGPIDRIPENLCPKKVWRHFYDPHEHWERICRIDIAALRSQAEDVVGATRASAQELPSLDSERWRRAKALLTADHDDAYAPAYGAELSSHDTVWTPSMDTTHRLRALTPRSVFVVVQLDQPRSWVVTAFRPRPQVQSADWEESELRQHAVWYFRRVTGINFQELAQAVTDNLRRASSPPSTAKGLWWLASAVSYGRLLRHMPEVQDALLAAEKTLIQTPDAVREALRAALEWTSLTERLSDSLKEARPEDLEAVLADAEELLAVAPVVGAESEAETFCQEAELLLPWLPVEWTHLADRARHRGELFAAQPSLSARLWSAVENATTAAIARVIAPSVRPASRLADRVITQQPLSVHWTDRLSRLETSVTTKATAWIVRTIEQLTMAPLAPTMGGSDLTNDDWTICGWPTPDAPAYRVFVVDTEHPDGLEVTEQFTEADGELWRLTGHEQALVVIIAGESPLAGLSMAQVLEDASTRNDVVARTREFQPTQATKARR